MGNFFSNMFKRKQRIKSFDIDVEVTWRLQKIGTVVVRAGGRTIEEAQEKAQEVVTRELVCMAKTGKKTGEFELSNKL